VDEIIRRFVKVCTLFKSQFGKNSFLKYDELKDKRMGQFSRPFFEVSFLLVFHNYEYFYSNSEQIDGIQKHILKTDEFARATKKGIRSVDTIKQLIKFEEKLSNDIAHQ